MSTEKSSWHAFGNATVAGLTATTFTMPLERMWNKKILNHVQVTTAKPSLKTKWLKIFGRDALRKSYAVTGPVLFTRFWGSAAFYGSYKKIAGDLNKEDAVRWATVLYKLSLVGMGSAVIESILTFPAEYKKVQTYKAENTALNKVNVSRVNITTRSFGATFIKNAYMNGSTAIGFFGVRYGLEKHFGPAETFGQQALYNFISGFLGPLPAHLTGGPTIVLQARTLARPEFSILDHVKKMRAEVQDGKTVLEVFYSGVFGRCFHRGVTGGITFLIAAMMTEVAFLGLDSNENPLTAYSELLLSAIPKSQKSAPAHHAYESIDQPERACDHSHTP